MRANTSMTDWIDAKASLPRLLSEIAFGDQPAQEAVRGASLALAVRSPRGRTPRPY